MFLIEYLLVCRYFPKIKSRVGINYGYEGIVQEDREERDIQNHPTLRGRSGRDKKDI